MINLLDRYLQRLIDESGAHAAVIGDTNTTSVIYSYPPERVGSGAASLTVALADPGLELSLIWSDPPATTELSPESRLLIDEEISYLAGLLAKQSRLDREVQRLRSDKAHIEELFQGSMNNAAVGMCITTLDGQFTQVNHALCMFFGYEEETLLQMTWQELTAPGYVEPDLINVGKMIAGQIDSFRLTKLFVHADGTTRWGDLSVGCLRNADGDIERLIAQITDVTATKDAADQFRLLAENAGDVVTHVRDGRFVWVSPSIEKVLGAPASYWVGREMREIIPPEDAEAHAARIGKLHEGGAVQGRARVMAVDGARHWVHLRASTFLDSDGRPDGVSSSFRVIDDEVAAEELVEQVRREQQKADARYRRSMETSNIGMCLLSPDGRFVEVNPSLCTFLGYDAETLKQKTWQELTVPEFVNVGDEERTAVFEGRRDSYRIVKQYIRADGHRVWADVSVSCIRDENGQVEHLASQIADITDTVEAQSQLAIRDEQNRALVERLQSEMRSAVTYVRSTLPGDLHGMVEVSSLYLPSEEIGGDGLHYRWLDDDHLKIYLVDVSGHGVRSALLSVTVHNLLRSGALPMATLLNPDRLLGTLNTMFQMDDQDGAYFTIWYGVYENSTRRLRYAAAGHPPALALNRESGSVAVTPLGSADKPIGMFADEQFTCQSYTVPVGAQLLVYSDGAFELPVADGRRWSYEEFVALCARLATRPDWSLDGLVNQLLDFSAEGHFDDDCSLILATFA